MQNQGQQRQGQPANGQRQQQQPRQGQPQPNANLPATRPSNLDLTMGGFLLHPDEVANLMRNAEMYFKSGLLPGGIKSPQAAAVILLKSRSLGIDPMDGFAHIHVINGKPSMSAELMVRRVREKIPTARIDIVKADAEACTVKGKRPDGTEHTETFTIAEAKTAGLLVKDNWKAYPKAMLRARCLAALCRFHFPEALGGISYTPDELGAVESETGDIIQTTGRHVTDAEANAINAAAQSPTPPQADPAPIETAEDAAPSEPAPEPTPEPIAEPSPRLAELAAVIDELRWPKGTVLAYAKETFQTGTLDALKPHQWGLLLNVVRNSNAVAALGEFATTMDVRA